MEEPKRLDLFSTGFFEICSVYFCFNMFDCLGSLGLSERRCYVGMIKKHKEDSAFSVQNWGILRPLKPLWFILGVATTG